LILSLPKHHLGRASALTYVSTGIKLTYMEKTQIYFRKEELEALRKAAARSGRSVAELVRDAVRQVVPKPRSAGPVALWDGKPKRTSIEHDSVHDEP
jgi:hypothetical protein